MLKSYATFVLSPLTYKHIYWFNVITYKIILHCFCFSLTHPFYPLHYFPFWLWRRIYNLVSHSTIKLASPNGTKATQLLIYMWRVHGTWIATNIDGYIFLLFKHRFNQIKNVFCRQFDLNISMFVLWEITEFKFLIRKMSEKGAAPTHSLV